MIFCILVSRVHVKFAKLLEINKPSRNTVTLRWLSCLRLVFSVLAQNPLVSTHVTSMIDELALFLALYRSRFEGAAFRLR